MRLMPTLITAAALAAAATSANASDYVHPDAIALSGDKTLHAINGGTAKVFATVEAKGVDKLLGIDLQPSTGRLIGVTASFDIIEIDPESGDTRKVSTMSKPLPLQAGAPVIVDFNPKADKLRFMSGTTNHRVDVDSGAVTVDGGLAFEGADMHAGETPNIVAAAYTNSYGKPSTTAMFDIDATIGALIQQTSPNDGTLAAVGKLGTAKADVYAFDIATNKSGQNTAWLAAGGQLHVVSLETGKVEKSWKIEGVDAPLRDITFFTAR